MATDVVSKRVKPPATAKTLKDYFGLRPGEGLKDFAAELKALTPEDKEQLVSGIRDESYNY